MDSEKLNSGPQPSWISVDDGAHDQTLVESWLLRLRRERFQSRKSGKTHDFYVTHLADGVHAIAVTTDQRLVMVRQFRAGRGATASKRQGACSMQAKIPVPPALVNCWKRPATPVIPPSCWVRSTRFRPCSPCRSAPLSFATRARPRSHTSIRAKSSRSSLCPLRTYLL